MYVPLILTYVNVPPDLKLWVEMPIYIKKLCSDDPLSDRSITSKVHFRRDFCRLSLIVIPETLSIFRSNLILSKLIKPYRQPGESVQNMQN